MDPAEEQSQEIEVLQSIYPDELTLTNPTNFSIRINLDVSSTRRHALSLLVKYPETYPEVVPDLHIEVAEQDDEDEEDGYSDEDEDEEDDENKDIKLALNMAETIEFEKEDLAALLVKLQDESEVNIGIPMVFSLITLLKEEAELLFENKLKMKNLEFEQKRKEQEIQEQKKFQGTKVTVELWTQWRNAFRKEMRFAERDHERFEKMHGGKLTGRQIFEQGLANTGEGDGEGEDDAGLEDGLVEGIKKI
ncbi:Protein GIR2 [Candida viswanathii]|uniref:Protein GIR2 n=1 Tax=Candida viswanathii TaxID=5486 RepID=A0A367YIE5_9ASCO|nr:Protein GIR2 [Candida viswanathii]